MKHTVTNEAVHKWAKCLREGLPTKDVFPAKMTDCEFTEAQKDVIRKARSDKKAKVKALKKSKNSPKLENKVELPIIMSAESKSKPLTKLRKMLYLQQGKCFFCGEALDEADASIEHLQPLSRGGLRAEDNEVICHKSINETFGQMDLKRKIEFILRSAHGFQCPKN